jgi:hypothetical protein
MTYNLLLLNTHEQFSLTHSFTQLQLLLLLLLLVSTSWPHVISPIIVDCLNLVVVFFFPVWLQIKCRLKLVKMRVLWKRMSMSRLRFVASQACTNNYSSSAQPHVAIVGSGPAGFYTAQQLIKVSCSLYWFCLGSFLCIASLYVQFYICSSLISRLMNVKLRDMLGIRTIVSVPHALYVFLFFRATLNWKLTSMKNCQFHLALCDLV